MSQFLTLGKEGGAVLLPPPPFLSHLLPPPPSSSSSSSLLGLSRWSSSLCRCGEGGHMAQKCPPAWCQSQASCDFFFFSFTLFFFFPSPSCETTPRRRKGSAKCFQIRAGGCWMDQRGRMMTWGAGGKTLMQACNFFFFPAI